MAEVVVKDLVKRFGSVVAVNHIDFEVQDREFVVLLGPSGCGKTTTLRMIAGLEIPDGGTIEIGKRDVTYLDPKDRNIGMVFERYALYPHLSVFENLAYPLRVRKRSLEEIKKRVNEVAEVLKIGELVERRPSQLSGGQMQRVAIGRAIIREASVFLMDEPISHLDAKLRSHMRGELKRLQREIQSTTVYVSHDQIEAMSMADRIAVLNFGEIQQFDTPERIFNLPSNRFVANFVGEPSMNFLPCSIRQDGKNFSVEGDGFQVAIEESWIKSSKAWGKGENSLILGIRPEHILLHPEGKRKEKSLIEGKIYVVEPLGTESIYDIEVGNTVVRVRAITSQTRFLNTQMGHPAWLEFEPDRIYLFDSKTEEALAQAQFALMEEKKTTI
jgi:multiple sugar transport system ATP-binding protein